MSKFDFFAVVNPDGILSPQEIEEECQSENWAPIQIVRTPSGEKMVPLFKEPDICMDFIRRNLPRKQMVGILGFNESELFRFTEQGWIIEWHTHPKLYTSRPGYSLEVGVISSDFDLYFNKTRKHVSI